MVLSWMGSAWALLGCCFEQSVLRVGSGAMGSVSLARWSSRRRVLAITSTRNARSMAMSGPPMRSEARCASASCCEAVLLRSECALATSDADTLAPLVPASCTAVTSSLSSGTRIWAASSPRTFHSDRPRVRADARQSRMSSIPGDRALRAARHSASSTPAPPARSCATISR